MLLRLLHLPLRASERVDGRLLCRRSLPSTSVYTVDGRQFRPQVLRCRPRRRWRRAAQGEDGHDDYSEAEEESVYSEELSGSEAAEDEWWAQGGGGRRDSCFGGDFGDTRAQLEG